MPEVDVEPTIPVVSPVVAGDEVNKVSKEGVDASDVTVASNGIGGKELNGVGEEVAVEQKTALSEGVAAVAKPENGLNDLNDQDLVESVVEVKEEAKDKEVDEVPAAGIPEKECQLLEQYPATNGVEHDEVNTGTDAAIAENDQHPETQSASAVSPVNDTVSVPSKDEPATEEVPDVPGAAAEVKEPSEEPEVPVSSPKEIEQPSQADDAPAEESSQSTSSDSVEPVTVAMTSSEEKADGVPTDEAKETNPGDATPGEEPVAQTSVPEEADPAPTASIEDASASSKEDGVPDEASASDTQALAADTTDEGAKPEEPSPPTTAAPEPEPQAISEANEPKHDLLADKGVESEVPSASVTSGVPLVDGPPQDDSVVDDVKPVTESEPNKEDDKLPLPTSTIDEPSVEVVTPVEDKAAEEPTDAAAEEIKPVEATGISTEDSRPSNDESKLPEEPIKPTEAVDPEVIKDNEEVKLAEDAAKPVDEVKEDPSKPTGDANPTVAQHTAEQPEKLVTAIVEKPGEDAVPLSEAVHLVEKVDTPADDVTPLVEAEPVEESSPEEVDPVDPKEEVKSVAEETETIDEEGKAEEAEVGPTEEDVKPAEEESKVEEDIKPVEEVAKPPVEEDVKLVEEEVTSPETVERVEEGVEPVEETTSAEGEVKPVDDEVKATEEEVKPVEEELKDTKEENVAVDNVKPVDDEVEATGEDKPVKDNVEPVGEVQEEVKHIVEEVQPVGEGGNKVAEDELKPVKESEPVEAEAKSIEELEAVEKESKADDEGEVEPIEEEVKGVVQEAKPVEEQVEEEKPVEEETRPDEELKLVDEDTRPVGELKSVEETKPLEEEVKSAVEADPVAENVVEDIKPVIEVDVQPAAEAKVEELSTDQDIETVEEKDKPAEEDVKPTEAEVKPVEEAGVEVSAEDTETAAAVEEKVDPVDTAQSVDAAGEVIKPTEGTEPPKDDRPTELADDVEPAADDQPTGDIKLLAAEGKPDENTTTTEDDKTTAEVDVQQAQEVSPAEGNAESTEKDVDLAAPPQVVAEEGHLEVYEDSKPSEPIVDTETIVNGDVNAFTDEVIGDEEVVPVEEEMVFAPPQEEDKPPKSHRNSVDAEPITAEAGEALLAEPISVKVDAEPASSTETLEDVTAADYKPEVAESTSEELVTAVSQQSLETQALPIERPKSPWTPSYSVSQVGPGVDSTDLTDQSNIETTEGNIPVVAVHESGQQPSSEASIVAPTPERPKSPWTPSYSTTVQGSPSRSPIQEAAVPSVFESVTEAPAASELPAISVKDVPESTPELPIEAAASVPESLPPSEHASIQIIEPQNSLAVDTEDRLETPERPKSPWTPSYSVTTQGSPLIGHKELGVLSSPDATSNDATEDKDEAPHASPSVDTTEEKEQISPSVPHVTITLDSTSASEGEALPIISPADAADGAAESTIKDKEAPLTIEPSTDREELPGNAEDIIVSPSPRVFSVDVTDTGLGQVDKADTVPSEVALSTSLSRSQSKETLTPEDIPERPKSPWTPSYSVTNQGSPRLETQALKPEQANAEPHPQPILSDDIVVDEPVQAPPLSEGPPQGKDETVSTDTIEEPKSPWTPSYSVTRQGSTPSSPQPATKQIYIEVIPSESATSSTSRALVQNDDIDIQSDVADASIATEAASTPRSNLADLEADTFSEVSDQYIPDAKTDFPEEFTSPEDISLHQTPVPPTVPKTEETIATPTGESAVGLDVTDPPSDLANASVMADVISTPQPSLAALEPDTHSEVSTDLPDELTSSHTKEVKSDTPILSNVHLAEETVITPTEHLFIHAEPAVKITVDRSSLVDEAKSETTGNGASESQVFPSTSGTETTQELNHKQSVSRPDVLDEHLELDTTPATLEPTTRTRTRLESTASSRFFPGGWFSSSPTIEGRTSLENAQGEFTPSKSPSDMSGITAPATTPVDGLAEDEEKKSRWCTIM